MIEMSLIEVALSIIASVGMTIIITQSTLFKKPRDIVFAKTVMPWKTFLMCPICIGFWAGIISFSILGKNFSIFDMFLYGCVGSGVNHFVVLWNRSIISDSPSKCGKCQ